MIKFVQDTTAEGKVHYLFHESKEVQFGAKEETATWLREFELNSTIDSVEDGFTHGTVSSEYVEGLPLTLVQLYADIAARHSIVREVDPGVWLATVAGLEGAWGDGSSPGEAYEQLHEAIIGWIAVKRRIGAADIPLMEGIDLNLRPQQPDLGALS